MYGFVTPAEQKTYGGMVLTSSVQMNLASSGTYYKITGFTPYCLRHFSFANDGIYCGHSHMFHFTGTSDAAVDKACTITYCLGINGGLDTAKSTPHTYIHNNKTETLAITSLLTSSANHAFTVWAKSDQENTVLSISTLNVTFIEV